jgi:hypothetical protein
MRNLEEELTQALRSLETILDILIDAEKGEHSSNDNSILRLSNEDVEQIGAAIGAPEVFKEAHHAGTGAPHAHLLPFKQRVSKIRAFAASRRNS